MKQVTTYEWMEIEEGIAKIGIRETAAKEIGEIVYIELPPLGTKLLAGEVAAILESTKAATDIYTPIGGEVLSINQALLEEPGVINRSPEEEGWLFTLKL